MKNGLNTLYIAALIALFCANTGFAQQSNNYYMVDGKAVPFEKPEPIRTATVWQSADDTAPPKPIKANRSKHVAPYSLNDPFFEHPMLEDTGEEIETESNNDDETESNDESESNGDESESNGDESESNNDKTEDSKEFEADLEFEETSQVDPSTIEAINPLRRPMSTLSLDIRDHGDEKPNDESLQFTSQNIEHWSTFAPQPATFSWAAPNIRYQPLYFENVPLERYGQTRSPLVEVAAGGVHFYRSLVLLPYHAAFDHPKSCDYPLGFCRPGNCTNRVKQFQWWGW